MCHFSSTWSTCSWRFLNAVQISKYILRGSYFVSSGLLSHFCTFLKLAWLKINWSGNLLTTVETNANGFMLLQYLRPDSPSSTYKFSSVNVCLVWGWLMNGCNLELFHPHGHDLTSMLSLAYVKVIFLYLLLFITSSCIEFWTIHYSSLTRLHR